MKFHCDVETLVAKMFVVDQTSLVNSLIEHMSLFDDIKNYNKDEDEDYYPDILSWILVDPGYTDVIEEGDLPYLNFKGQMWVGKTFSIGFTSWDYLKNICVDDEMPEEKKDQTTYIKELEEKIAIVEAVNVNYEKMIENYRQLIELL